MHTEESPSQAGPRERTLVGYAPAPELPGHTHLPAAIPAVPGDQGPIVEAAGEPPVAPPAAPDVPGGERRNPLSRRQPINRGRHLSKQFFEEGDRQQERGWEDSPLAADGEGTRRAIGFDSFDEVPKRRAPMVAATVVASAGLALLAVWAFGAPSADESEKSGVWSALQQQGAGWKPPTAIPSTESSPAPPPVVATPAPAAAAPRTVLPDSRPSPSKQASANIAAPIAAPVLPTRNLAAPASPRAPAVPAPRKPSIVASPRPVPHQPATGRPATTVTRQHGGRTPRVRTAPVAPARNMSKTQASSPPSTPKAAVTTTQAQQAAEENHPVPAA
ncbi:MAG: hypothetical protein ABUS79_03540, partial [Pseudomonadota bacterium]